MYKTLLNALANLDFHIILLKSISALTYKARNITDKAKNITTKSTKLSTKPSIPI